MCLSYREIRSVDVKARKGHMCEWCAEPIRIGESARYRAYSLDGDLVSGWMHPECLEAMNKSEREAICEGWMAGDFERGIAA